MNQELTKEKKVGLVSFNVLYLIIKRTFDIVVGIIGTILLLPMSIILKLVFLISGDREPLFFVQKRVGKNGQPIYIYKYRSMVVGAEDLLKELMKRDKSIREEYQKNKKLKDDPRVTKVGKILRKTCIDEMPQFINLLKGDMSLVGPRPYLFGEIKDMGDFYETIVSVKPGLTGLWQVSDKYDMSFRRRCVIEEYYAKNCGLLLDIKILFKTIVIVIFHKGTN